MKKKQFLCSTLLAGSLISLAACSSETDYEVLSRENFAEDVFKKDSSQFVHFDFSTLSGKQRTELEKFIELSKKVSMSGQEGNGATVTRSLSELGGIDISDMDQTSPLVKIINSLSDPEVAAALQAKDVNRYLSLLEQKGALSIKARTRAAQNIAQFEDGKMSLFWIYGAVVAVVAVAYAAVVADVVVIGPSMADNGTHLQEAVINGDIMTLDLEKISDDEESNRLIDKTISESLQGENDDKISLVQNIAKSAYYEYK